MTSDNSASWPTLRSWMGAGTDHPLRELLEAADAGSGPAAAVCTAWDDLLRQVELAGPNRWQGKRREFRGQRSFSETLSEHCELVLAVWLACAGIKFEFGQPGQPQPDLVLPDWGVGIEVGSRTLNMQLEDEIRAVFESRHEPEQVDIIYDTRPLTIRETDAYFSCASRFPVLRNPNSTNGKWLPDNLNSYQFQGNRYGC